MQNPWLRPFQVTAQKEGGKQLFSNFKVSVQKDIPVGLVLEHNLKVFDFQFHADFLQHNLTIAVAVVIKPIFQIGNRARGFTDDFKAHAPPINGLSARLVSTAFLFLGRSIGLAPILFGAPGAIGFAVIAGHKTIAAARWASRFIFVG